MSVSIRMCGSALRTSARDEAGRVRVIRHYIAPSFAMRRTRSAAIVCGIEPLKPTPTAIRRTPRGCRHDVGRPISSRLAAADLRVADRQSLEVQVRIDLSSTSLPR